MAFTALDKEFGWDFRTWHRDLPTLRTLEGDNDFASVLPLLDFARIKFRSQPLMSLSMDESVVSSHFLLLQCPWTIFSWLFATTANRERGGWSGVLASLTFDSCRDSFELPMDRREWAL